jgi:hypothetical protein
MPPYLIFILVSKSTYTINIVLSSLTVQYCKIVGLYPPHYLDWHQAPPNIYMYGIPLTLYERLKSSEMHTNLMEL